MKRTVIKLILMAIAVGLVVYITAVRLNIPVKTCICDLKMEQKNEQVGRYNN